MGKQFNYWCAEWQHYCKMHQQGLKLGHQLVYAGWFWGSLVWLWFWVRIKVKVKVAGLESGWRPWVAPRVMGWCYCSDVSYHGSVRLRRDEAGWGADAGRRLRTLSAVDIHRHSSVRQLPFHHAHEHHDLHRIRTAASLQGRFSTCLLRFT